MPTLVAKNDSKISEATNEAFRVARLVGYVLDATEPFGVPVAENELYQLIDQPRSFIENKLMNAMSDETIAGFSVSKKKKLDMMELPSFTAVEKTAGEYRNQQPKLRYGASLSALEMTGAYTVAVKQSYLDSLDSKYSTVANTTEEEELFAQATAFRAAFNTFSSYMESIGETKFSQPLFQQKNIESLDELFNPVTVYRRYHRAVQS